jgi:uncharacterized membrane protein YbhN (UPF0104 family)
MSAPPVANDAPKRRQNPWHPEDQTGSRRYHAVAKKLRLAISVGLLAWLAWRIEWFRIRDAFSQLRIEFWFAAVGMYLFAQFISAIRWKMLSRPLGFHDPLRQFTAIYFIGMYFNLLLPTSVGGDVVRAWCLNGKSHRRLAAFLSVFVDRLSGLCILVLVACAGVVLSPTPLPHWITGAVCAIAGAMALLLAIVPFLSRSIARTGLIRRLAEGLRYYWRHPRILARTSGLSIAVQLANVALVWLVSLALGMHVSFAYYAVAVPLITLITLLPISLNGMGIREASTVLLLGPVGVAESSALCLAVLWFFALTAGSLCGGIVYFFGWTVHPEACEVHESVGRDSDQGRAGQSAAAA